MNYANSRSTVDCDSDHASDVVQVAFCEPFRPIEWVNPDDHVFLEEFIGELIVVVISFRRRHSIYLLHLLQVLPVAVPLHIVVQDQHFLTNMVLVELVGHDVGSLRCYLIHIVIFLTNDGRPGVELSQVVHDRVLDVHVHFSEDILRALTLLHSNIREARHLAGATNDLVSAL